MYKPIRFAPEQVLAAAVLSAALLAIATVWLATSTPSLGLELRAHGDRLAVAASGDPAAPVAPGTVVTGIAVPGGATMRLSADDLTPEPDVTYNATVVYRAFLQRQDALADLVAAPRVTLITAGGEAIEITPRPGRPVTALPWPFWVQWVCGLLGFLIGASVWAYKQGNTAVRCYALTGVGLMLAALSAAVYSSRELALPLAVFEPLRVTNQTGTLLYTGAFAAVLWHYPQRLGRFPMAPVLAGLFALLAVAAWRLWWPSIALAVRLPVLLGFALAVVFAVRQWRRSRGEPLARAGLRWFLFSWFIGSGLFLALVFVPPFFGIDAASAQAPAFLLLLVIHLALAVGILNYRLFELDRWWYRAVLVAFSGLFVYVLDLVLVYSLNLTAPLALGASLALVGWLYFPVRQWLWQRLTPGGAGNRQPALVRMVTDVLAHPEAEPARAWRELLEQVFAPRSVDVRSDIQADAVVEGGLALDVAGGEQVPALRLRYCRGGARLFNRDDLAMLADLRRLFAELLDYRQRLDRAVAAERDRVARDLHDDVGARLLTLSHNLDGGGAEQARQALTELRAVVYSMRAAPIAVADLLGDWRAEAGERCEAAGVELAWVQDGQPPDLALTGGPALALSRVLRETLSNALNHGDCEYIELTLAFAGTRLDGCLAHAYAGGDPADWRASLGLNNLRERLRRLGGDIEWTVAAGRLTCAWSVDLAAAAEHGEP